MLWFSHRKKAKIIEAAEAQKADDVVSTMQAKQHEAVSEVKKQSERLVRVLTSDSITLKIHKATTGGHNVR